MDNIAQHDGATGQATGTLFLHEPTAENPHVYNVVNPTAADIAAAANKHDYPRSFLIGGGVHVHLVYHTRYRPQAQFYIVESQLRHSAFIGNRNEKYRNPRYQFTGGDAGLEAFRKWWCQLPATVAERKYMIGQLRDVMAALSINDIPLATGLLADINLSVGDGVGVASHVKRDLVKALEQSMWPHMWDYMDPDTRPYIPYTPPSPSTSGTISGTISGTGISGTTITVSTA